MTPSLDMQSSLFRSSPTRMGIGKIDREGGRYGAGIIHDVAIITRGPALGHDMWVDREMLSQVDRAIKATGSFGSKSRFTHPGLSGDGLGKRVGNIFDTRIDKDVVRGDLHLSPAAEHSPDGNLREYVLQLAENHPESFGMSIAFTHDFGAERKHKASHSSKGVFTSPDTDNAENHPHARIAALRAVDVVDEPAANPSGLFHRGIITDIEDLAAYAFGLSDERPDGDLFDVHPDRIRRFVTEYLARNGLEIVQRQFSAPLSARRSLRSRNGVSVTIHNS